MRKRARVMDNASSGVTATRLNITDALLYTLLAEEVSTRTMVVPWYIHSYGSQPLHSLYEIHIYIHSDSSSLMFPFPPVFPISFTHNRRWRGKG